jgi:hypothetical protein
METEIYFPVSMVAEFRAVVIKDGVAQVDGDRLFIWKKGRFMAQFTVRVELHDGKWEDYEKLHAEMEGKGFSRLIKGDDGKTYHLPWAEYNGAGNLTNSQVRDIARTAAHSTGKQNAILVTKSNGRSWVGLQEAR